MATKEQPPVEVYARPFGYIQWMCPNCHELFGAQQIPWRRARIKCNHCARVFRIGVGFHLMPMSMSPFNAQILEWDGYRANRLGAKSSGIATARMRGRLDWMCPCCIKTQSGKIGTDLQEVVCQVCDQTFYLNVILYRSPTGSKIKCPIDWTVNNANV